MIAADPAVRPLLTPEEQERAADPEEDVELADDGAPVVWLALTMESRLREWTGTFRLRLPEAPLPAPAQTLSDWLDDALVRWSEAGHFDVGPAPLIAELAPYAEREEVERLLSRPDALRLSISPAAPAALDPFFVAVERAWGPLCIAVAQAALPGPAQARAAATLARLALVTCGVCSIPVGFAARALDGDAARAFAASVGAALLAVERGLGAGVAAAERALLAQPEPAALLSELERAVRRRRESLAQLRLENLPRRRVRPALDACKQLQLDVHAGALIGLREPLHELRKEIGERLLRHHVEQIREGKTIDWNPTLQSMLLATDETDRWISHELERLADLVEPAEADRALARPVQAIKILAAAYAGIASVHWAFGEAEAPLPILDREPFSEDDDLEGRVEPVPMVGGESFSDDMQDRVDPLMRLLDELRAGPPSDELNGRIEEQIEDTFDLIKSYGRFFAAEMAIMAVAAVAAAIAVVVMLTRALAVVAATAVGMGPVAARATVAGGALVAAEMKAIGAGVVATASVAIVMAKTGGPAPPRAGRLGERRSFRRWLPKPKERFPSMVRPGMMRAPDRLTAKTLQEVKNVLNLALTRQLTDYILYAGLTNRRMTLWLKARRVGSKWKQVTKLSRHLQGFVDAGDIRVRLIKY
jgi:hypothetical protein